MIIFDVLSISVPSIHTIAFVPALNAGLVVFSLKEYSVNPSSTTPLNNSANTLFSSFTFISKPFPVFLDVSVNESVIELYVSDTPASLL